MNAGPMQSEEPMDDSAPFEKRPLFRRFVRVYLVLLVLLLLALIPPLVKFGRYRHGIVQAIGQSLGRPVQVDDVSLQLLPVPALELQNFVVFENPQFGSEPVMRAETVTARLRLSSLWRRQVEVSRIELESPSINLVHLADGRWNVDSILLQASHVNSAPTAQVKAGPDPRFPYIEATSARMNLKMDQRKMPLSLTDADFALWQPEPGQWRVRVKAHPLRTNAAVSDAGQIVAEATFGRAATFAAIPLVLHADWSEAPLGEASRVATGQDMGWRGTMDWSADVQGTFGESIVATRLELHDLRRADFVPQQLMRVEIKCAAKAHVSFHRLEGLTCVWPQPEAHQLKLTAEIPELLRPASWSATIATDGLPLGTLLEWNRLLTPRLAPGLHGTGLFTGSVAFSPGGSWQGGFHAEKATLLSGADDTAQPIVDSPVDFETLPAAKDAPPQSPLQGFVLHLKPVQLDLGGKQPVTLDGQLDGGGYSLQLSGPASLAKVTQLGGLFPQFGKGLEIALHRDGTSALLPDPIDPKSTGGKPDSDTTVDLRLEGFNKWGGNTEWFAVPAAAAPRNPAHTKHR